jgi:predicted CopG family antitoxin
MAKIKNPYHIVISAETAQMLKDLGKKGETYDEIIRRLIQTRRTD